MQGILSTALRFQLQSSLSRSSSTIKSATSRYIFHRNSVYASVTSSIQTQLPRRTYYAHITDHKMAPKLEPFFKKVDELQGDFVKKLETAVAIPSVSSDIARRPDVVKMGQYLESELKKLGAEVHLHPLGKQKVQGLSEKDAPELPPLVLARYGNDTKKRTVLVYGHYDVQPAKLSDGWSSDPFKLHEVEGRMYGRGSTDDKGPVLGWLNVIEAHQKCGVEFPVNLLCCFEGMEEYGSDGLEDFVKAEAKGFFKDADAVCISDNYWLGTEKPCVTYGLRGCNYYSLEISGPAQDLHSGVYGGTVQEPMTDLMRILGTLVDTDGRIKVPGIYEMVDKPTDEERALYPNIAFTMDDLYHAIGSKTSIYENKVDTLMARWRFPSLSIHGVEGAFYEGGAKTVIPAKVIGKFSIRTVPTMNSDKVDQAVYDHIDSEFKKLGSKNTMKRYLQHAGPYWKAEPTSWNFKAGKAAAREVFGVEPDMTREGGSIPVTNTFEDALSKPVILLPMGSSTDAAHSINEKLDRFNYVEGTKLLGAYLHYVADASDVGDGKDPKAA